MLATQPVNALLLAAMLACCACVVAQTRPQGSSSAPTYTEEPTTGTISGSVVNESGQPLAGVRVSVREIAGGGRTSITDAEGKFHVNGLGPALYFVSAFYPAYVSQPTDAEIPSGYGVYLVPAEREKSADVLRYSMTTVQADGTFALNSLPPGRYFSLVHLLDAQTNTIAKLRLPESAETRTKLRRTAETQKTNLELKPCENLTDYQLSIK